MPHDVNGKEIKVGDAVKIVAIVESVTPGEDYCNVTLKPVNTPQPADAHVTITTNAKIVELVEEATAPEVAPES